jgi:hypothetical protein
MLRKVALSIKNGFTKLVSENDDYSDIKDKKTLELLRLINFLKKKYILNLKTCGEIIIARFGSSDYKNKCKSHLKHPG